MDVNNVETIDEKTNKKAVYHLICNLCLRRAVQPIYQCREGHIYCGDLVCRNTCPDCVVPGCGLPIDKIMLMDVEVFETKIDDKTNSSLIETLICCVCRQIAVKPIFQCRCGFVYCGHPDCQMNTREEDPPKCVISWCKQPLDVRCRIVENMLDHLPLRAPCRYSIFKCDKQLLLREKNDHEIDCHFRPIHCILEPCDWSDTYFEYMKHLTTKHNHVIEDLSNNISYCPIVIKNDSWVRKAESVRLSESIKKFDNHFVFFLFKRPNRDFDALVLLIGEENEAKEYGYGLCLLDKRNMAQRIRQNDHFSSFIQGRVRSIRIDVQKAIQGDGEEGDVHFTEEQAIACTRLKTEIKLGVTVFKY